MFSPCLDRTPSAEGDMGDHQHREHIKDAVMDVTRTKLQGQKKSGAVNSEVTLPEIVDR